MKLKKYRAEGLCLFLALIINILMFLGLTDGNREPVLGIKSGRTLFLFQLLANLLIICLCLGYRWLTAVKKSGWGTVGLIILSPVVNIVVLESLTGNLTFLPRAAIVINLMIGYVLMVSFPGLFSESTHCVGLL